MSKHVSATLSVEFKRQLCGATLPNFELGQELEHGWGLRPIVELCWLVKSTTILNQFDGLGLDTPCDGAHNSILLFSGQCEAVTLSSSLKECEPE
jgi:hypothetical protein